MEPKIELRKVNILCQYVSILNIQIWMQKQMSNQELFTYVNIYRVIHIE